MLPVAMTTEIMSMLAILALAVFAFASDIVRTDVGALFILLLLGLLNFVPGLDPWIAPETLFDGFSSNAVIAIMAVMMISRGLNKTGLLERVAELIIAKSDNNERRVIAVVGTTVGLLSSFMQNTGAAALFIPVTSRIAVGTGIALQRLLLPMAFCAIVGGTLTLVGSSPLILLNDLLPPGMPAFELFDVSLIGLILLTATVALFILAKDRLLPKADNQTDTTIGGRTLDYFKNVYDLDAFIYELVIPHDSELVGQRIIEAETKNNLYIVAAQINHEDRVAPARDSLLQGGTTIAVLAGTQTLTRFVERHALKLQRNLKVFANSLTPAKAGISELVIPPDSELVGQTIAEIKMRPTYGLTVLAIHRAGQGIRENLREVALQAGDTLVCHSSWSNLARLKDNRNFIVVTSKFPQEDTRPHKVLHALACLALAIGLVLFTELRLSVALMTGAVLMVLTHVITMDEAYAAISWRTVFLLASLVPVGIAVEQTGTAQWIAQTLLFWFGDVSDWVIQLIIALLAVFFSLTISNVGATVLLVPLAINMALQTGADPRLYALIAALGTTNAFLLPTHQVNALIMGPGKYHVTDFTRAGIWLTLVYLVVMLATVNMIY